MTSDQTITHVTVAPGRTDSSTNLMHMTAAGSDARIDMGNNTLYPNMGAFNPGPRAVLIMRNGGGEIVFMNPDKKEYMSIKPIQMMQGMQKMLEGIGGSMTLDTAATTVNLDSLGPGPAIDGHPTLQYRLTTTMRMTISMMGQQNVINDRSTQEIDAATDLGDFKDAFTGAGRFADILQSMAFAKDLFEKASAMQRKMKGFPVRSVKHSTNSVGGKTRTITETIETKNIKRVTVPDSLFAIPADYKSVSMPALPGTGA